MSRMFCFLREFRWFSEISLHANTRTHSHKWSTRNHRQNVCMVLVLFLLILIVRLFSLSSSSFCTSFYGGYLNVKELERWFGLAIECNNAWLCSHQSSLAVFADTCVCFHWFWALKYMLAHKPASWLSCRFDTEYLLSASSECKTGNRCTVYIVLCLRFKISNLQKIMWFSISIHTLNSKLLRLPAILSSVWSYFYCNVRMCVSVPLHNIKCHTEASRASLFFQLRLVALSLHLIYKQFLALLCHFIPTIVLLICMTNCVQNIYIKHQS